MVKKVGASMVAAMALLTLYSSVDAMLSSNGRRLNGMNINGKAINTANLNGVHLNGGKQNGLTLNGEMVMVSGKPWKNGKAMNGTKFGTNGKAINAWSNGQSANAMTRNAVSRNATSGSAVQTSGSPMKAQNRTDENLIIYPVGGDDNREASSVVAVGLPKANVAR